MEYKMNNELWQPLLTFKPGDSPAEQSELCDIQHDAINANHSKCFGIACRDCILSGRNYSTYETWINEVNDVRTGKISHYRKWADRPRVIEEDIINNKQHSLFK